MDGWRTGVSVRVCLMFSALLVALPSLGQEAGGSSQLPGAGALLPGSPAAAAAAAAAAGITPSGTVRAVDVIRSYETPKPAEPPPVVEPKAAPKPTDFQQFAAVSVGVLLPLFGQDLFSGAPSTFAPVDDLPATADYSIGPGDEVVIRGWGQLDVDVRAVVSREGTISIPRVGVVNVSGTRYGELPELVRKFVGRYYRNFELAVSLGKLRSIHVFVVGQAARPGLYTVGALSTLMNALFASGGPSSTGSMRRVQLRRADKLVGEFDLYDLLLRGDKSKDLRLQSGDVIFIPPVGSLAAIAGRVKTPAIYELKNATTVRDLIEHAGGQTTTTATQSVLLERIDQLRGRVERELPWDDVSLSLPLSNGDVVLLRSISQRFDNAVTLRGHVAFPVRTAWREGLTVADLIPDRSILVPDAYWARAASRSLDTLPLEGASLKTKVEEINWDYAVVERIDRSKMETRLIPFNLGRAIVDRDPASNLKLEPGDIVTIFSRREIASPAEKRTYVVRIEGEIAVPGVYQVRPGETLRELVQRAGGLSAGAYLFGAEFTRDSVRRDQQQRLEEVTARAEQEMERTAAERLARAVSAEEVSATRAQVEQQRRAIARLRALKASGRMVLELEPGAASIQDLPDLTLEDGDRLFVPFRSSTIGVYGAVYAQGHFIYKPGKSLSDYLSQAGGPARGADEGSVYVLRADGSVISKRQAGFFTRFNGRELMPSDSIVVPEDFEPFSLIRELKDWSQIFYQFGLGVAALKVLL